MNPICESKSDQSLYNRLTITGYPLTAAQKAWLESLRAREYKKFQESKP